MGEQAAAGFEIERPDPQEPGPFFGNLRMLGLGWVSLSASDWF